eukprot:s917_g13.t1
MVMVHLSCFESTQPFAMMEVGQSVSITAGKHAGKVNIMQSSVRAVATVAAPVVATPPVAATPPAPVPVMPTPPTAEPLLKERKKRCSDQPGPVPGPKRQKTALEALRKWAAEWPITERVAGKEIAVRAEDVIAVKSTCDGSGECRQYAVLSTCPSACSARLRMSEKQFVQEHAMMMKRRKWFQHLEPEDDWCKHVGVITDADNPVDGIKYVVTRQNPLQFTLPLVETKKGKGLIAGYVHATHSLEDHELRIAHLKVDTEHQGKGLGGLLLDAAEQHSERSGWNCKHTSLSVLKHNVPAGRCYAKASCQMGQKEESYLVRMADAPKGAQIILEEGR